MKKNNWFMKFSGMAMIAGIILVSSCKDEERLTGEDTLAITEEAIADSYYEDTDDLSSVIVYETDNPSGGRVTTTGRITSGDERVECADIIISENSTFSSGQIVIDFGEGCTVRGNKRAGKIILTYSDGPRGTIGFTVVMTFENYTINGIELKGTRTVKRITASAEGNIKHEITLTGGQAIWPENGGTATRSSTFTREWFRDVADERVELEGNAEGTTRRGRSYTVAIDEPLVYRRACILTEGIYMAVEGVKVFQTDGKQITIDYGDGECDRSVNISVNGTSRSVTVGNN